MRTCAESESVSGRAGTHRSDLRREQAKNFSSLCCVVTV
jgi:hypothetical protein